MDLEYNLVKETIASMEECRHLCNEVCCNEESKTVGAFVDHRYCEKCPLFTKEDGIVD